MRRTSLKIMEDILRLLQKKDAGPSEIQKKVRINSRVYASKMIPLVGCGAVVFLVKSRKWTLSEKGRDLLGKAAELNSIIGGETP